MFISYMYGYDWLSGAFYGAITECFCDGGGFPWHRPSECIMMVPPEGWECE